MARGRCSSGSCVPSFTTSSWARPSVRCRKPSGSNSGCGVCQKASSDHLLRHLRRARAVRVPAHAVDRDQERCVLGNRRADPILILLAPAHQADIGVFDPQ